jgi:hypothetical protein
MPDRAGNFTIPWERPLSVGLVEGAALLAFGRSLGRYWHNHVFVAFRDVAHLRQDPCGYEDFPFFFGAHPLELRRWVATGRRCPLAVSLKCT